MIMHFQGNSTAKIYRTTHSCSHFRQHRTLPAASQAHAASPHATGTWADGTNTSECIETYIYDYDDEISLHHLVMNMCVYIYTLYV